VRNNLSDADRQKATQSGAALKVAGSGTGERKEEGIAVMMSMDKDESTRKMERDAEAAAKRQQNALPAWHMKSTISGDMTALGIIESARVEAAPAMAPSALSNDEILRGLGVVGSIRSDPISSSAAVIEDVKPVINHESDCESSSVCLTRYSFLIIC
jgi:transcription initiation factor TFIIE subunit alpha